jgi:hypothetical protein
MLTKDSDFAVDLEAREVRHSSGVVISFGEYTTEADWLATDAVNLRNPDLFPGDVNELAAAAKRAALAAGMRRTAPGKSP